MQINDLRAQGRDWERDRGIENIAELYESTDRRRRESKY